MFKYFIAIAALFYSLNGYAQWHQVDYNLGMEEFKADSTWTEANFKGYTGKIDTAVKHSGRQSVLLTKTDAAGPQQYVPFLFTRQAKYEGKEIEFKAWMKLENVTQFAAIMINEYDVDGNSLQFKSLQPEKIRGTKDWNLYSIKVPLAPKAQFIAFGSILGGGGKLWTDDWQLLIDGQDITKATVNPNFNPNPPRHPKYGNNASAGGWVKLKDASLYYETYGSGQPLLLLHGDSQSINAFLYQIPELSKHYKVIAVDTRGQGKSKDLTTGPLNYQLFANDMKQLLDSLHIKKTNVIGWSDGGITGLLMAINYPGYVNKLAITGANLEPSDDALEPNVLKEIGTQRDKWNKDTTAHGRMETRLFTMMLNEPHIPVDNLKTINAPVLVMAGEKDVIRPKHTELIAKSIPNATLYIFKGTTHYVPVDKPDEFNRQVLSFFGTPGQ
jgi:pimeloyl-ACP methyl ester carboxylesterase